MQIAVKTESLIYQQLLEVCEENLIRYITNLVFSRAVLRPVDFYESRVYTRKPNHYISNLPNLLLSGTPSLRKFDYKNKYFQSEGKKG